MGGADELFGGEQAAPATGADELFGGEEAQPENRLKFVMDQTIDETPERAARSLEIQKRTGIPKKFIDENFDELDKSAKRAEFNSRDYLKNSPKVADWLGRNPDYAPLLREDIATMGVLEQTITKASDYARSIGQGVVGQGAGTTLSGAGELYGVANRAVNRGLSAVIPDNVIKALNTPIPWWLDPEQILKRPGEELKAFGEKIAPPMERRGIGTDIASGIGQLGFQIATALMTGPTSAVTTMLAQGADIMAEKTAKDDAEQANKDVAILAGAGITAITEKFGLDMILSRIPPAIKNTVLRQIADISFAGGIEAAQEFTEGLLHDVTRRLLTNADAPMLENIDREMIAAGGSAAIVRTVINATLGVRVRNDYKERAKLQEDFFKALGDNSTNSKLRERLPDSYQEIVKDLTKDGPVENVYAPVEFFQSHFQEQNIDPRQLATELGIERQYDEALNTGGKIAIPLDVYAKNLAPTEHNAVFARELSFGPDQMSSRETDEFLKESEKEKEPETDTFGESLTQAMTPIREQLKAIYPADVADKNAAVIEARLRSRASRLGIDPQELMRQRPMEITEGGEATGTELMQAQKQIETPEFAKWFSGSKVVDESGKPLVVYHATNADIAEFDNEKTSDGGFHFGLKEQANMRTAGADKNIIPAYIAISNPRRSKDLGGKWKTKIASAKADGHDGIVYLNRYEGINLDTVERAQREGVNLDRLSDAEFRRYAPEARDSYIAFRPEQIKSSIGNRGTFSNDPNILKQGQDIKRGSISISPSGDVIRLFQAKNLSTLLHELSHRWLFEMQDDAALPDAPQQIKDDLAATLKYLGVESVEELDITKIEKGTEAYAKAVAANEKFAETGEAYLMEGKAPSAALRRVFAQIRAWLVAVYKALKQGRLNGGLTPEMRAVFDRLLATDEEIGQAKAEANAIPIFTTAVDAGMTDIEFAAYRKTIEDANREEREELDAKVMSEYKKTLTDIWKEEKAKVQVEVEAELDVDPVYLAMAKMKENGVKIARSEATSLPRSLTAKDGIPADMAAEMLGFTSGEALVKALASVEPRGARAARETNIRMDQRFGNLLTDGKLVEEARKAVMGDGRAKIIEAEIKALNKKAREVKPFVKANEKAQTEQARAGRDLYKALVPKLANVREHAATVIAGKPIRELRPMQYYNAARQASREAINDVRKKDYLMAGYNKGRELLNLELYREAIKAQDMIEDGNQKLQKVFVADIKQSKSRNMDMVNAARAILASHGLGKTEAAPSTYLDKMRQYDPEVYENLRPIFEPAIASMKPYKNMTVEEYIGMRDAVLALMKTSRRSKQIEIDGKLIDRVEAVAGLINRMMDFDKGKSQDLRSTLDDLQKTKIGLLSVKAVLRRVESWITAMDGGPDGVFRKFIWNPVSDAVNLYRDKKREVVAHYLDIVQQVAPTIKPGDIEAPELRFKFRGKTELLHALLHTGNESNKTKLLIGYGWGERNEEGVLDSSRWDAFEKRMRDQGKLTKADYDFAQNVWDMMEGMKPALQEAHHRMYGYYFNEVTAKEFSNEFGTYRGGYVPAKVDVNVVQEAEQRKDAEEIVQGQNSFAFPTSGKGATMSRVEGYARPLQLDMRTIPAHIDWAMRFAYLEPAVKDVARVVLDKDFSKSLNGLDPTTINHMLVPWLQRTAQQITSTRGMNKWADKFWTGVRSRSGMQVMVLNVINTLQQYTGLTIAFTRVKPSNIRSAFWMYMTHHKEFSEEINEKSSFMRNRVFTAHNEVMQTIDDLLLNPSKYEKAKDFATKHGYFMQQATQGFVDQIVWHAAYSESLSNGQTDKDAVRHADSVVRETQGSFAPEDISRFEAGTPFLRAFSMFYNYFNMQANLLGTEAANIASNELGLRKGAGRALYVYTFAFMIPAYIGGAIIRVLVAGGLDEDDDDEYMDDLIRLFFSSQFEALTAMVPAVGPVAASVIHGWNDKWYDDKITASPAIGMIEGAGRTSYALYKSIVDDGYELNQKRAVKNVLNLIGMVTGLPAGALGRPLGYLADVHQGKANPENALDVTRGLISGQDVNRS